MAVIRRGGVLLGVAVALLVLVLPASPAAGAEAEGCSGSATSFTVEGEPLDQANAPGLGGTLDHPFVIDTSGTVEWQGSTAVAIPDGTWNVTVSGISVSDGSFENRDLKTSSNGTYNLGDLPDAVTWLLGSLGESKIPVTATISGATGTCTASGYLTGVGSPFASPLFYSGIFFLLIALLLLLWLFA